MDDKSHFEIILKREVAHVDNETDIFIQNGSIGRSIFFSWYAKVSGDKSYQHIADRLIAHTYKFLSPKTSLDIKSGLLSVGLALCYLMKKKYVLGNMDDVLRGIDEHVYRVISTKAHKDLSEANIVVFLNVLLYFIYRLKNGLKAKIEREVYEQLVMQLFNDIYMHIPPNFLYEPLPFSVDYRLVQFLWASAEIHMMGFYDKRVEMVWKEMKASIFSLMPILNSNRLALCYVMAIIGRELGGNNEWESKAEHIRKTVNVDIIIEKELKSCDVFFSDGISGIYLLLQAFSRLGIYMDFDESKILTKIKKSEIWNLLEKDQEFFKNHAGLDGFCGLAIMMYYIDGKQRKD